MFFEVLNVLLESPSCMPKNKNIVLIDKKIFKYNSNIFWSSK